MKQSFFIDLAFGQKSPAWSLVNYAKVLTDPYYLRTLWLTTYISLIVAAACIGIGFPIAKVLARLQSRWTTILLSAIVLTSFITMVIQIFGLIIIFRADGPVNSALLSLGMIDRPFALVGTAGGVVVGLIYASFGFAVMLMYGVVQDDPGFAGRSGGDPRRFAHAHPQAHRSAALPAGTDRGIPDDIQYQHGRIHVCRVARRGQDHHLARADSAHDAAGRQIRHGRSAWPRCSCCLSSC